MSFLAWLGDIFLGPACPHDCGHRARGPRTLHDHLDNCPRRPR